MCKQCVPGSLFPRPPRAWVRGKGVMSKAKCFAARKPSTSEIIATSANQIVPPKFRGPTKMLYYTHQTPLSSCSVEGAGSGDETNVDADRAYRDLAGFLDH